MKKILTVFLFVIMPAFSANADIQQLLQLVDYVGVDYAVAVQDGKVVNPAEYQEMRDFVAGIGQQSTSLADNPDKTDIIQQAAELANLIANRAPAEEVSTLAAAMRMRLINSYKVAVVPRKVPDLSRGRALYSENCVACHGADGLGNGSRSAGMEPSPTNFQDYERYSYRTLYGLFNTITQGVPETAMRDYGQLSDHDRWSLAFYVGHLAVSDKQVQEGEAVFHAGKLTGLSSLETVTVTTPAEAEQQSGHDGALIMAYVRSNPDKLFSKKSPLGYSRARLADSLAAYQQGNRQRAYQLAVDAYLEGFELVEPGLDAVDSSLRRDVEMAMTSLRNDIRAGKPLEHIRASMSHVDSLLAQASDRLNGRSLSKGAAFGSAFFILVREGLEALLVVVALGAFLVKTGRRDGLHYLHIGWIGALAAGFLTWLVSISLLQISGASREITEGAAALLAAAVLFYVGFWLHDKTHAEQWKRFIEHNVNRALTAGTLWGIAGLSFVAVYREVFETILFYQALWVQTDAVGKSMALSGLGAGAVVLAIIAWLVIHYSVRLPLRQFFGATGLLMFVLAIIFAGKGVAALQEAGYIPVSPVNFPRIDILGIYPNLQGLLLQAGMLILGLFLFYGVHNKRNAVAS